MARPSVPSPSAAAAASETAAAVRRVQVATGRIRSYAFTATETIGASRTTLTGRAVRPASLTYLLAGAGRTEQVIRVGAVTYRRVPPAPYRRLMLQRPAVDPLRGLLLVLERLQMPVVTPSATGTRVVGQLDAAGLAAAGLVSGGKADPGVVAQVTLSVDTADRVTQLMALLPLSVQRKAVTAQLRTTFTGFDRQAPVSAPGA